MSATSSGLVEPSTDESSPRSILTLDKSNAPFPARILEACEFLGVGLPEEPVDTYTAEKIHREPCRGDPRVDWALRWLLKNFQSANIEAGSPHVDRNAWLLFSELVLRTPLSTTSRLLKAFEFPKILYHAFQWLFALASQGGQESCEKSTSPTAASPSSDAEAPSEGRPKNPKKRKRRNDHDQATTLTSREIRRLHVCMCSSLGLLLELSEAPTTDLHGYAVEHLRAALRTSIEYAASMLGSSLTLASTAGNFPEHAPSAKEEYSKYILPVVKYWRLHTLYLQHSVDNKVHRAFSRHSLLPCLQILNACSVPSDTMPGRQNIVDTLQELVVYHTILPARALQLDEAHSKHSQSSDRPANLIDELLASILTVSPAERNRNYQVPSIKALFEIAVRRAPPRSPKERRLETSWIQNLFMHIAEHLSFFDSDSASVDQVDSSCTLIHDMLRSAVDQGILFDTLVLERIVHRLFESFQHNHSSFWETIGACINMNTNIFLSRPQSRDASDQNLEAGPNQLLCSLFGSIRKYDEVQTLHRNISDAAQMNLTVERRAILKRVIVPLAQAFADARDFNDFLGYWQSQLAIVLQDCNHWEATIWENDELLQLICDLTEPSLTIRQIEQIFSSTCDILFGMIRQNENGANDVASCMAMLIVSESVASGCTTDMALQRLEPAAFAVQELCFNTDFTKITRSSAFKSRLWRLFATLNNRWPLPADYLDPVMRTAKIAVEEILESVEETIVNTERASIRETPSARQAYSEKIQALRFILSLTSTEKGSQHQPAGNPIIASLSLWVEMILDRVTLSYNGKIESKAHDWGSPSWKIRNEPSSPAEFAIAILVLIVHSLSVLKSLTKTVQYRIYEEIYQHAFADTLAASSRDHKNDVGLQASNAQSAQMSSSDLKSVEVTSRFLWFELAGAMALKEEITLAANFRDFQISKFLQCSEGRPNVGDIIRLLSKSEAQRSIICPNEVALDLLRATPPESFTKTQRVNLCNRVLQQVIERAFGRGMLAEALHLLTSLVRMPSATMLLLSEPICQSGKRDPKQQNTGEATLFAIATWLDNLVRRGEEVSSAVAILRQLTFAIMEYLTTTMTESSSSQYIQTIYKRLNGKLEDGLPLDRPATSAVIVELVSYNGAKFAKASADQPICFPNEPGYTGSRSLHLAILCRNLDDVTSRSSDFLTQTGIRSQCLLLLQCMASYTDSIVVRPDCSKIHSQIGDLVQRLTLQRATGEPDTEMSYDPKDILVDLTRLIQELQPHDQNYHKLIERESLRIVSGNSLRQKRRRAISLRRWLSTLDTGILKHVLKGCVQLWVDRKEDYDKILMLECILLSRIETKALLEDPLDPEIAGVFGVLCDALPQIPSLGACCLAMGCLDHLLKFKPKIIAQHHIDSLLCSIIIVSYGLKEQPSDKHASKIYLGLCKLLSTSFLSHRKKLGGRYHLVVRGLRGLLRCLFIPYTVPEHNSADTSGFSSAALPLTGIHAAAYARLLTIICDPPLSTISRSKENRNHQLNDEAKKARSTAGQYMQYVIEEWCVCQLSGRLLPEMRAALNPGIWTVLAAMSPEVMRKLNAAMDSSARSIFKALYDDFKRVGH